MKTRKIDLTKTTYQAWLDGGGCGISHCADYCVSKAFEVPERKWRSRPLADIMAACDEARRTITRYAVEEGFEFIEKEAL